jgi:hypothetical protein
MQGIFCHVGSSCGFQSGYALLSGPSCSAFDEEVSTDSLIIPQSLLLFRFNTRAFYRGVLNLQCMLLNDRV